MKVIILISGKAQHGKDTLAKMIKRNIELGGKQCRIIHFGDNLKNIAKMYYEWDGNKDEKGRTLLQWLGTDYARTKNQNIWIDKIKEDISFFGDDIDCFVIPDCRFPNELEMCVDGYATITIRVNRNDYDSGLTEEQKQHPSETALDNSFFNYIVENDNLENLNIKSLSIINELGLI